MIVVYFIQFIYGPRQDLWIVGPILGAGDIEINPANAPRPHI